MLLFGFLLLTASPAVASAQSLIGSSQECGTYSFGGDLTKGRTDSMVYHVHHTAGCFTYDAWGHIGADREEMASNSGRERAWQTDYCKRAGVQDTVNHFRYYRNLTIDPADVKVSCGLWTGGD